MKAEDKSENEVHDLVILGGGPAGLTASIYAGRDGLNPVTINGPKPGGQVINTETLENYPGFPDGIQGPDLAQKVMAQAENHGADLRFEEIIDVDLVERPFRLSTHLNEYAAHSLIIATGARPRKLGLEKEQKLTGNGVSYCATCDGAMYEDDVVAVVGGGDSALEEADYLTQFARSVYLIHRRDEYRAGRSAVELIEENDRVEPVLNAEVVELMTEDGDLSGLRLQHGDDEGQSVLDDVDGLFVAIGYEPNTELICSQLECDDWGYIKTDDLQKTSVEGVFAAGDVQDHHFQQVITAAASGAKAAMEVNRYLRRRE